MIQYFYGEDTYGAREAIADLAADQEATIRWVDKEELQQQSVAQLLGETTGLFGRQLLVLRDPLQLPKAVREGVVAAVQEAPAGGLCVLWERGTTDKRSAVWKAVKAQAREFAPLSEAQLVTWLQSVATEMRGAIEPPAAQALVRAVGVERWRLRSELERLLLMHSSITVAVVAESVVSRVEAEIFSTLTALVAGKQSQAVRNVMSLLTQGEGELYILSMLAYQFRMLVSVRRGVDAGKSPEVIAKMAGLHPYAVKKTVPLARRWSAGQALVVLTKILATDFAIKQGKVDARTGLLLLVMGIAPAQPVGAR